MARRLLVLGSILAGGAMAKLKTLVADVGAYPGSTASAPAGTIAVTVAPGGIDIKGTLIGLPANATSAGIHIHSGFVCDDAAKVGGHFYEGMNSDPWTTTYASDANGVAQLSLLMQDFTLNDQYPVAGRAIVVHNDAGERIGCGVLQTTGGQVTHLGTYPGYTGNLAVKGTVVTADSGTGSAAIRIKGTVAGLEASTTGGFHIHSGFSCSDANAVGGHYFEGMSSDPWLSITYTSDAAGAAQVNQVVNDFSLFKSYPVMGRDIVFHNSSGSKVGCGVIGAADTLATTIGAYPGHTGNAPVGTVIATETSDGIRLKGLLTGLAASATGGMHIHAGFTCSDANSVGGHFFEAPLTTDPWTTTYISDAKGVATVDLNMAGLHFNSNSNNVVGRAFIVHDSLGTKVGCGLLQVSTGQVTHIGTYPGDTGNMTAKGTIVTTSTATGITMLGTLAGLPASTTAGIHIHSGFTCDADTGVRGHYHEGMSSDPWTTTYTSDAAGVAAIALNMNSFSLYATYPVVGRAVVVHDTTSKIGCGLIDTVTAQSPPSMKVGSGLTLVGDTLVASLAAYSDYTTSPGQSSKGTLAVTDYTGGILIKGTMTGLPPSTTAGMHIHSGFSCADTASSAGHYYEGMAVDPWTTTYTSDANGMAAVELRMPGFSLRGTRPVAGRAFVVHDSNRMMACGLLQVTTGQVAHIEAYPGYAGLYDAVRGTVLVADSQSQASSITMTGTLGNLEPSTVASYRISTGLTCSDSDGVGAKYLGGLSTDPWTVSYSSDAKGAAEISQDISSFTLYRQSPVAYRAVVFFGTSSTPAGCGLIDSSAETAAGGGQAGISGCAGLAAAGAWMLAFAVLGRWSH